MKRTKSPKSKASEAVELRKTKGGETHQQADPS
jgi:hypothetical protein